VRKSAYPIFRGGNAQEKNLVIAFCTVRRVPGKNGDVAITHVENAESAGI